MAVKPITPGDVAKQKGESFPDAVFEAFNEIIAASFVDGCADFTVAEVVKLMVSKGLSEKDIFDRHWLDVEAVYEKAGWHVVYDKPPGFNESYEANFAFTVKRK
ncbi:MAG TPA: hypothetical protein VI791_02250 [Patescibacteria group bacterium]|nr:hypothetical protein [Patescibacteria group bacterium]